MQPYSIKLILTLPEKSCTIDFSRKRPSPAVLESVPPPNKNGMTVYGQTVLSAMLQMHVNARDVSGEKSRRAATGSHPA